MRIILLILLAVWLIGCASFQPASLEKLTAEVNSSVKNQMLFNQAQIEFGKLGFTCHEGTSIEPIEKGIYECSRN